MSFLNGLSGLAGGLGAFNTAVAADDQAAKEAKEAAPAETPKATPILATPATPPEPTATPGATPEAQPASTAPASAATGPGGVPAHLLPIYEAAARRTGIPVAVLIAQGKQESGFNPDLVGSAGEIGIAQIKPSTASQPGYGVRPVDPATLRDPRVAINFQADYMRARAGMGVDFSNPAAVDAALAKYNGGGDPNYIQNVRRHMGAA